MQLDKLMCKTSVNAVSFCLIIHFSTCHPGTRWVESPKSRQRNSAFCWVRFCSVKVLKNVYYQYNGIRLHRKDSGLLLHTVCRGQSVCLCLLVTFVSHAKNGWTGRDAFGGADERAGLKKPCRLDGVKVGRIHSPPRGVTRRRCGFSSKFFDDNVKWQTSVKIIIIVVIVIKSKRPLTLQYTYKYIQNIHTK